MQVGILVDRIVKKDDRYKYKIGKSSRIKGIHFGLEDTQGILQVETFDDRILKQDYSRNIVWWDIEGRLQVGILDDRIVKED